MEFNLGKAIVGFLTAYWNLALWVVTVVVGGYAVWKLVFDREDRNVRHRRAPTAGVARGAGSFKCLATGSWRCWRRPR
jgi:hypothetical protein